VKVLGKVTGFSLALAFVFTLVANLLPQVEGEAPAEAAVQVGALTMDSFTALGEEVFKGKGTCTLCHNNMGRAPYLLALNAVETAASRLRDPRYQGGATDAESYLRESMVNPSAYVVKGYGQKGSDDTKSPMPQVDKAPIQLSALETNAVIAFLQAKDGHDVTVPLPSAAAASTASAHPLSADAGAKPPAPVKTAQEAIVKFGCPACHTVLGTQSPVGPNLTTAGGRLKPELIRQSIIDPGAVIAKGFPPIMPADFAERMTVRELELIVQFLARQK